MRYYIYLLQIFGGGNPKIHEIIHAYGSAKGVYEKVSSGDMTLVPSNRVANAKKASLEISDRIITFCKNNKISIITIDDKAYPKMLKNIYNPPTVLFVEGDLSCLSSKLSISVVGPRIPDTYAVRLAVNICSGLAGCKTVLVSGFANGIDSIAHNECIKRNQPTVAVLACGHTIEYPAHTFGMRAQIKKAGGAVISELLPDTECCKGYFKFRNRIISGLTYGTVVVGGYNGSGTMHTANRAFEQDRDLFFTLPPDTLDEKYTKIVEFLRDGAKSVYDFYDVINEYYETYKDVLDDTHLDKNRLSSFSVISDVSKEEFYDIVDESINNCEPCDTTEEEIHEQRDIIKEIVDKNTILSAVELIEAPSEKEIKLDKSDEKEEKVRRRKEKKVVPPENRFVYKARGEEVAKLDYSNGTPQRYLKKKKKTSKGATETKKEITDVTSVISDIDTSGMTDLTINVLSVIKKEESVTIDRLMTVLDEDIGALSESLADLEISGVIKCCPGGVYIIP